MNYLAYSWLERNYKIDEAVQMLEDAYSKKENDPYITDSVGWGYYLIGDYNKAEKYLKRAVELMPYDPIIHDHYGDVLWQLNRKIQAKYFWESVLELEDAEENLEEIEASKYGLAYIKLNGSIGCMVNGAGLAMATMDIIKLYDEEPANFLDVGGGASKEKVAAAFKLILSDKNVKGILINIFGGIMQCDVLAQGVVDAAKETGLKVPLVVRLAGTNFKKGKEILDKSNLKILSASDLNDAAKKVVEAIR